MREMRGEKARFAVLFEPPWVSGLLQGLSGQGDSRWGESLSGAEKAVREVKNAILSQNSW
jgi:hypothetical protein